MSIGQEAMSYGTRMVAEILGRGDIQTHMGYVGIPRDAGRPTDAELDALRECGITLADPRTRRKMAEHFVAFDVSRSTYKRVRDAYHRARWPVNERAARHAMREKLRSIFGRDLGIGPGRYSVHEYDYTEPDAAQAARLEEIGVSFGGPVGTPFGRVRNLVVDWYAFERDHVIFEGGAGLSTAARDAILRAAPKTMKVTVSPHEQAGRNGIRIKMRGSKTITRPAAALLRIGIELHQPAECSEYGDHVYHGVVDLAELERIAKSAAPRAAGIPLPVRVPRAPRRTA